MLLLTSLLFLATYAHDKCVLRLEDIDMPSFVVDLTLDVATNISVVSPNDAVVNETACDLTDPEFFRSLTLVYNTSNLNSILEYVRFIDLFNVTASRISMENVTTFISKPVITSGELAKFVADLLDASYESTNNITQPYSWINLVYHLVTITLRGLEHTQLVIHDSSLAEKDKIVARGWEQMPRNLLSDNEIYRGIIARKSVNNTLFPAAVYEQPYTIFEQTGDYLSALLCRSQPFDKYGFRRATLYELIKGAALSGEFAKFMYRAKMMVQNRISSLPPIPLKNALVNGLSAGVAKIRSMHVNDIIRPEFRTYGGITRRLNEAISTVSRSLPAAAGMMSRAWYNRNEFNFAATQRSMRTYETLIASVQKIGASSSIKAASEHNLLINDLWKSMFLPASSVDRLTQSPQVFELSDFFSVRYWWDPAGSWSGFAPSDRKVIRMTGFGVIPIPADAIAFVLWVIKYFGRSPVLQAGFNYFNISNVFGNSTNSPFGVTNDTLCLPAPQWFWPLPDPEYGCTPPQIGPFPVIFETIEDFLDYVLSMLVTNITKYDPWINPLDKIPAILQLLSTSILNETIATNPSLQLTISLIETGVNIFWQPFGLLPFRIWNPNMPKYAWLTLMWVVPASVIIIILMVLLLYGSCVGYCIPMIGNIIALGDPAMTVSGNLVAQMKLAANAAFASSITGIKKSVSRTTSELERIKREKAEKRRLKEEAMKKEKVSPAQTQEREQIRAQARIRARERAQEMEHEIAQAQAHAQALVQSHEATRYIPRLQPRPQPQPQVNNANTINPGN